MARKFLYIFATLVVLVIIAALIWSQFQGKILGLATVPSAPFVEQKPLAGNEYARPDMWFARPGVANDPAQWLPTDYKDDARVDRVATFFVHPTSYIDRTAWNAPLDNAAANNLARIFLRGQASAFNGVGQVWAPRYRQATFGAFLTTQPDAVRALDAAYGDVSQAFDAFVASIPADRPIVLAGHSQGARHLTMLLRDKVAGKPIARRIVAAYVVGWPVSLDTDLAAIGMPACAAPDQAGCLLSWQSFAEPAEVEQVVEVYDATTGFDGRPRRGTNMVCTNPLTGTQNGAAPASANTGTLVPNADLSAATLQAARVPARCDGPAGGGRGFLLIGAPPAGFGQYVLPGNNYHVFDYSLFWRNVRADVGRRLATFEAR